MITVLTDYGTEVSVDSFEVAFQGAMVRNPTRSTTYNSENDTAHCPSCDASRCSWRGIGCAINRIAH